MRRDRSLASSSAGPREEENDHNDAHEHQDPKHVKPYKTSQLSFSRTRKRDEEFPGCPRSKRCPSCRLLHILQFGVPSEVAIAFPLGSERQTTTPTMITRHHVLDRPQLERAGTKHKSMIVAATKTSATRRGRAAKDQILYLKNKDNEE